MSSHVLPLQGMQRVLFQAEKVEGLNYVSDFTFALLWLFEMRRLVSIPRLDIKPQ